METLRLPDTEEGILAAAEIIKRGGLVGMPTETVYGLAADALNEAAVTEIFKAKGRPQDNPLIVHIANTEMLSPLIASLPEKARLCLDAFWPGPFTAVLPKSSLIPSSVCAGLDTVAVRMPSSRTARRLIELSGLPIAAPSANTSGAPSPTSAEHVLHDMDGRIDAVIMSEPCSVGVESTVVTFATEQPRLLRPGGVTLEQLRELVPDITVDPAVLEKIAPDRPVASPGMKYKHYSPKCSVTMVKGSSDEFAKFVNSRKGEQACALCFKEDEPLIEARTLLYGSGTNAGEQAAELFDALRALDDMGCTECYAHAPALDGVGLAVYNRLIRAAAFKVVIL